MRFYLPALYIPAPAFPGPDPECFQPHIQNGLCLYIVQREPSHQVLLGIVIAGTNDVNDFVNIVLRNQQTFQQMRTLHCFFQIISSTANNDFFLKFQIFVQHMPGEIEFWAASDYLPMPTC